MGSVEASIFDGDDRKEPKQLVQIYLQNNNQSRLMAHGCDSLMIGCISLVIAEPVLDVGCSSLVIGCSSLMHPMLFCFSFFVGRFINIAS